MCNAVQCYIMLCNAIQCSKCWKEIEIHFSKNLYEIYTCLYFKLDPTFRGLELQIKYVYIFFKSSLFSSDWLVWTLFNFSMVGYIVMILASVYVEPPSKLPHLWTLMISVYSAGHFLAFWPYFLTCQYQIFQTTPNFVTSEKKNK